MQVSQEKINPTKIKLTIQATEDEIKAAKNNVVKKLSANVKVPGFRAGKAPSHLIEKNIEANILQSEVVEELINRLYPEAAKSLDLRIVSQPQLAVTKFVPFTDFQFTAEVDYVGEVKLADYKKIKIAEPTVSVTAKDVNQVLDNLAARSSSKKVVDRKAKDKDEVIIDFAGYEVGGQDVLPGTDGKDYPLSIGSNSFIPGFEQEMIGLKKGDTKSFDMTFPKDYGAKNMQGKKVTFKITVKDVNEQVLPKIDDQFASTVGPFKSLTELKSDIKKQLTAEKKRESQQEHENKILEEISKKSQIAVPESLIAEEVERMEAEEKRNIIYRGQTWQEHLDEEGLTEEQHREKQKPTAEARVKIGIILGEISEAENIKVTEADFEKRMQDLRKQYQDPAMQAELDKIENQRDIMSRMLTEKTLDKLRSYATK